MQRRTAWPRATRAHSPTDTLVGGEVLAVQVVTLLWASIVATAFFTLAPVLIGALMDQLQLSVREVGFLSTAQLTGAALGNLVVLRLGRRFQLRPALGVALLAVALCEFASALAHALPALVLWRFNAGAAAGFAFAAANAAAARLPRAGVMYAGMSIAQMVFGAAGFWALPSLLSTGGLPAAFLMLGISAAGCGLAALILAPCVRIDRVTGPSSTRIGSSSRPLIGSLFAVYLATSAVWTYLDRVGIAAGLQKEIVSHALALGMVAGMAGALLSSWLLFRARGTETALIASVALVGVSTALLAKASSLPCFWLALFGFNGALALLTPLYLARLAADAQGDRQVVAALLAMYLGLIAGPTVGGDIIARLGYLQLIMCGSGLLALAAALVLIAIGHHPRRALGPTGAIPEARSASAEQPSIAGPALPAEAHRGTVRAHT